MNPIEPSFPGVQFGDTTLGLPEGMEFSEWERLGRFLVTIERNVSWWLGQWAVFGEEHYGEDYAQAISDETGYAVETVRQAQWVAERVTPERRREALSFSHHRAVAALEPDEQDRWLGKAEADKMTTRELYSAARGHQQETDAAPDMTCPSCGADISEVVRRLVESRA